MLVTGTFRRDDVWRRPYVRSQNAIALWSRIKRVAEMGRCPTAISERGASPRKIKTETPLIPVGTARKPKKEAVADPAVIADQIWRAPPYETEQKPQDHQGPE